MFFSSQILTQSALFGYFWARIWKGYCHIWNQQIEFLKNEYLTHTVNFGIGSFFSKGPVFPKIRVRIRVRFIKYAHDFKVIWFVRKRWFYCFPELCAIFNTFDIQTWEITSFRFFSNLTHIFLSLLHTFLFLSDQLFRNLFLSWDFSSHDCLMNFFIHKWSLISSDIIFSWKVQSGLALISRNLENLLGWIQKYYFF